MDLFTNKKDSFSFVYKENNDIPLQLVYVDDVIITWSGQILIETLITKLSNEFALKDLGDLYYFLVIKIKRFPSRLFLHNSNASKAFLVEHKCLMLSHPLFL